MINKTTILVSCMHCKVPNAIEVNSSDLNKYHGGALIQECFPYLSANERELIISRTCESCFENMFKEEII